MTKRINNRKTAMQRIRRETLLGARDTMPGDHGGVSVGGWLDILLDQDGATMHNATVALIDEVKKVRAAEADVVDDVAAEDVPVSLPADDVADTEVDDKPKATDSFFAVGDATYTAVDGHPGLFVCGDSYLHVDGDGKVSPASAPLSAADHEPGDAGEPSVADILQKKAVPAPSQIQVEVEDVFGVYVPEVKLVDAKEAPALLTLRATTDKAEAIASGRDLLHKYDLADLSGRAALLGVKSVASSAVAADDRRRLSAGQRPTICGGPVAHALRRLGNLGATATEAKAVLEDARVVGRMTNVPEHDGDFDALLIVKKNTLRAEVERSKAGHPGYSKIGTWSADDVRLLRSVLSDVRAAKA